jgi:hypothetical protein
MERREGSVVQSRQLGTVERVRHDPRLAVIIAAGTGEPPAWVMIEGVATVHDDGGIEPARRLAPLYYDEALPRRR